jgi:hypothetical protein
MPIHSHAVASVSSLTRLTATHTESRLQVTFNPTHKVPLILRFTMPHTTHKAENYILCRVGQTKIPHLHNVLY